MERCFKVGYTEKKGLYGHVRTSPEHHISLCYQSRSDFIVSITVALGVDLYFKLDRIRSKRWKYKPCLAVLVASELVPASCLQVGNSSSFIFTLHQRMAASSGAERRSSWVESFFSAVLLQGGEVYKRLRSQVRGSQRRLCRCLRSALKAVLVPCTYEHNIISYIIFQLCEDVLYLRIKSTGNGLAQSGDDGYTLQHSQSHRDYLPQGSYYLIVAQIDYCF